MRYTHYLNKKPLPSPSVIRNKQIKRQMSLTNACLAPIDPSNPTTIEGNYELVQKYAPNGVNTPELEKYFEEKAIAANEFYREQSNSAAAAGTTAKNMQYYIDERDYMLKALQDQKEELEEMDYNPTNPAEYDFDTSSESGSSETASPAEQANPESVATSQQNTGTNPESVATSQQNTGTSSDGASYQDSSDVVQTSFDPSDYYDD